MSSLLCKRLAKLEAIQSPKCTNKVLCCSPIDAGKVDRETIVWQRGMVSAGLVGNQTKCAIRNFKGKFIICPEFESMEVWESTARIQQQASLAVAERRAVSNNGQKANQMFDDWTKVKRS